MANTIHPVPGETVFIAGHNGLLGREVLHQFHSRGFNVLVRDSRQLDLRNKSETESFLRTHNPSGIILCAAKVGGIGANQEYGNSMLVDNAQIQFSVLDSARKMAIRKLIFISSASVYPEALGYLKEDDIWSGAPSETHLHYAVAKLSGMHSVSQARRSSKLSWLSLVPTNIYGEYDRWDRETSHVVAALIMKIYDAQQEGKDTVNVWGSGHASREFLFARDAALAVVESYERINEAEYSEYNLTSGEEITVRELAEMISSQLGYSGTLSFQEDFPTGPPARRLDSSRLEGFIAWTPKTSISEGISLCINAYHAYKRS